MDALKARGYLIAIRKWLSEDNDGNETDEYRDFVKALDVALDAVAPPIGGGRCAWMFLPVEDMTPLTHLGLSTQLMDMLDDEESEFSRFATSTLGRDSARCLEMALLIYKSMLLHQHREKLAEMHRMDDPPGQAGE